LNVNSVLSYFQRIVPCGLAWAGVTSMAQELGAEQSMVHVRDVFLRHFAEVFGYSDIKAGLEDFSLSADRINLRLSPTI